MPCAAAFCNHCCGAHHRSQGHEVVVRSAAAQPGAARGGPARCGGSSRDSFCVTCGAGFSAALCGHHVGHDTFRVVVYGGRYCARWTGSEPWFHMFSGTEVRIYERSQLLLLLLLLRRRGGSR